MSRQQSEELRTYTPKERNMYLTGLVGQNMIYNIINGAFANFAQFTLAIPANVIGTMMAIARVWDACNDFMMGSIVDKTRTKWGKCRPYLIFVPLPILIITISCFISFGVFQGTSTSDLLTGNNLLITLWAGFTYILWGMTYTIGDIPLWGVTSLMTQVREDRNRLMSQARLVAGIGGAVVMLGIQPLTFMVRDMSQDMFGWEYVFAERMGYLFTAILFALIGCGLFQMTGLGVRERITPSAQSYTFRENIGIIVRNKPFRQLMLSGVLGSPKMIIALAAQPLVNYYYANRDGTMTLVYFVILGGGLFVGQFLFMALVPKLNQRFEKRVMYNYSNLIGGIPYFVIFIVYMLAPNHDVTGPVYLVFSVILFFVCGGMMGINTVLQTQMVADAVDYEEYKNGVRTDGVFFAGQTFLAKLTTGIATLISSYAMQAVGFTGDNVNAVNEYIANGGIARTNPDYANYMMVLFFIVSIPPAIGSILTVIPTWKYALPDAEHKRILGVLNERRNKLAEADSSSNAD